MPPSHQSLVRKIALIPIEDVVLLYSPQEVFNSAFWVWVMHGMYKHNVGYCPYDSDHQQLLFDTDAAHQTGLSVFYKADPEVVEAPHPDELAYHHLAEGDLVHIVQEELIDAFGPLLSVNLQNKTASVIINAKNGLVGQFSFSIFHLQCVYWHGDYIKVFAGADRGTEGFIITLGKNLTLVVSQDGENIEIEVDPMLVHSFTPHHSLSEPTKLDVYTHNPELPQDPIQIGDNGLIGKIAWIEHPVLWVYPLNHDDNDCSKYEGLDHVTIAIHVDHADIQAPVTLKFSSQNSYNVTIGDLVQVMQGRYCGMMGTVLSVDFCKASMKIHPFLTIFVQLHTCISLCCKVSNWSSLSLCNGCKVWVIAGNKKGCQAHLVALGHQSSIISMLGYLHFQIKNTDVTTSTGYLLSGHKLDATHMKVLIGLQQGSFIPEPIAPRQQTPPPSPAQLLLGFNHGSLDKHVVHSTSPD
ncbi:hypothetical protein V8B97DRAFT_2025397 [Scleroderma yunnanense]